MNKTELVEYIAQSADISKASAARSLDAVLEAITETLKKGETVTLVGFGTFSVNERASRSGRNPRTGEVIQIESARLPKFKPGKVLKEVLNS
ncbi:MAG: HU family DNA-binding protein [Oxalobacter sp.]|nr:HU family DNA-binding protein [Oxalobacter sp.]